MSPCKSRARRARCAHSRLARCGCLAGQVTKCKALDPKCPRSSTIPSWSQNVLRPRLLGRDMECTSDDYGLWVSLGMPAD
jgi:hypothetical protein